MNLSSRAGLLVALLLALAWPDRPAYADAKTDAAREHYLQGNAYYKLDRFKEALGEYEQAYIAKPDPSLLYNIAQCHRLMGNRADALKFYRRFIADQPQSPNRPLTEKHIRELEAAPDKPAAGGVAPLLLADPPAASRAGAPPPQATTAAATTASPSSSAAVGDGPSLAQPMKVSSSGSAGGGASTTLPAVTPTAGAADAAGGAAGADLRSAPGDEAHQKNTESKPVYKRWWFWTAIGAVVLGGLVLAASNKNPCESGRTCK